MKHREPKISFNLSNLVDETIFNEMQERQNKMNNVMIFNSVESGNDDQTAVNNIVRDFTSQNLETISIWRIGKQTKNGWRAVRIEYCKTDDVNKVIRVQKTFFKESKPSLIPISIHIRPENSKVFDRRSKKENAIVK